MPPATSLTYRPELSGLRAIAVSVVVLHHWLQPSFPLGEIGRCLFFVLSGYLVSGIIWKYDAYVGAPGHWWHRLRIFYSRRALRIIPPYYLALVGGALLPLAAVREYPAWFMLPGANLLFYRLQSWADGVGHYWTLAVDEQFYLLWPLVLGLTGRQRWPLLALAASGLAFRLVWPHWYGANMVHLLLPASLDLLALGSLLRLCQGQAWLIRLARVRYVGLGWGAGIALWLLLEGGPWEGLWRLSYISLGAVAAALTISWLLHRPPQAGLGALIRHPVLLWVGQRSYGFYLFHLPLLVFWQRLVYHLVSDAARRTAWMGALPLLLILAPVLALLSAGSWHFLEAPLDRLKERLPYRSSEN